ncbi:zinc finger X-chromosomal protein-like isoform X2 [Cephus cinctus]|uniref:Zinc finger X-chromosomal protein-like isoform X2 n=1 Tax=Cephus cinctus TaxID=211228 RepID=A0AAJ7RAY0_CEPCN|nr:zinc finger X-chromosomal protein-like isoform X2 [Cephus cinctus]
MIFERSMFQERIYLFGLHRDSRNLQDTSFCRYVDFTTFQATAVGGLVLSKSIQGENIKHACANCPSVFNQRHNLRHHIKFQCGQLPRFNCPYCHYRTRHSSNARAHIRRKHPGSKVYAIDVSQILD